MLGEYGILHLHRGPALAAINSAAERGIKIQILAKLHRRTIRFFRDLHDNVMVRHSDDVESQGALMDNEEVLQMLNIESLILLEEGKRMLLYQWYPNNSQSHKPI